LSKYVEKLFSQINIPHNDTFKGIIEFEKDREQIPEEFLEIIRKHK
jgi:uncharacterized protein YllA (UPF0747 family)